MAHKPADRHKAPPVKRFTIVLDPDTHTRIKLDCVAKHVPMRDAIKKVIERAWPPARAA